MKPIRLSLLILLFCGQTIHAQDHTPTAPTEENEPVFTLPETTHDFGLIDQANGFATCIFRVTNTGTAPLIIKHVQSSCGCTEPEWTQEPIEPGQQGDIVISYDPVNRPGPFKKRISVFTNEKNNRRHLTIQGEVLPKGNALSVLFHDTLSTVEVEQRAFSYNTVRPNDVITQEMWIRSFSDENIALSFENVPDYIRIEAPAQLKRKKAERFKITVDGTKAGTKGRRIIPIGWKTVTASGATFTQTLPVTVNLIDDFTTLTEEEKANSAAIHLSATLLDCGILKKGGFLHSGNRRVSRKITVTNTGKSALIIHSITGNDDRVQISGFNGQPLQPGKSFVLTLSLKPKTITDALEADLYILCNDPQGPVRQIKITAKK